MSTLLSKYKGKKVFVTGNTGFKGSWLTIWLLNLGAEVYGYALEPKNDQDNFVRCELESKMNQTYADVNDADRLKQEIKKVQPDYIFHLAAQALVIDSYLDPLNTFNTNIIGTANLMEAVKECQNLKSLVIITSDKCYENKEVVWGYKESDELGGKDPYSVSKACAELIVKTYQETIFHEAPFAIATTRAGNVIGGGDWSDNRLIPDIFKNIDSNSVVDIRNPEATRPWEHVLEPLSGYLQLGILLGESKEYAGSWNYGPSTYTHYSVLDIVKEIEKHTAIQYHVAQSDGAKTFHEAHFLKLDITKAANLLGWLPQLDFSETIRFTVEGYQAQEDKQLFTKRVEQIAEYTAIARKNKVTWAI
ncbi:MAG: CDP-glucose 4,6-dehydratase [Cyclobacteriaceae bacterium]